MEFVDTHAHIQFKNYPYDPELTWQEARQAGVTRLLVVGCDVESSQSAVEFAVAHDDVYAVVGVHPHEAAKFLADPDGKTKLEALLKSTKNNKIVAIGEFGLDYYYHHSPKKDQQALLRYQLELAQAHKLPVVLHIRDAFEDFWPIFDTIHQQSPFDGVVHCFSATERELNQSLKRGLYVALNGIMTFTKDEAQLDAAKMLPAERMLLETDAPFLTPKPLRGKICKPEHVVLTAQFLADLRGESLQSLADATTKNAKRLFKFV